MPNVPQLSPVPPHFGSFPTPRTVGLLVSLILLLASAARGELGTLNPPPDSTRRMAALLAQIREASDPLLNPNRCTEQVAKLRPMIAQATDLRKQIQLRSQLVLQTLQAGLPQEALRANADLIALIRDKEPGLLEGSRFLPALLMNNALCYLRMGEQENCLDNHNADSCLFPIRGGGVHQLQRGSRGAVTALTDELERFPGDLRARWLLNIAYMTLGEYPAKVPPPWLIDPKLFVSAYDIKPFPDVAGAVGLDVDGRAGGVVLEDFDNDGLLDVMVSSWGLTDQLRVFRNNGDGTFTERTVSAGLTGEVGGLNLIHFDYNNDGFMDVLVLRGGWLGTEGHYPVSLLRNNGDFTFTDVTEQAGLLRMRPTQTAVAFDFNGDGLIDLFIANETRGDDRNPCELYRNNGDGTFTECAAENGVAFVGFFKGVTSADFNQDGRPDLCLSRLDGPPILLRNDGPAGPDRSSRARWHFTDVSDSAGITGPAASFPCWFWDYDNDGSPDLFVSGYAIQDVGDIAADYLGLPNGGQRAKLYHNNGDGTFTDVTQAAGLDHVFLTMGCNFGDLDNDGWLDFYLGQGDPSLATLVPHRMFRNDGGRRFQDVSTSGGFGQLQKGHAIAFGDINNDGEQDIYSVVGGAVESDHYRHQLFANPGHGNHWLKLKLEGVQTNRAAIGAQVKVVVRERSAERAIYRTVGENSSFGRSPLRLEIGLGQADAIARIEIFWPVTGRTQILTGLERDRSYHVQEGATAAVPLQLKSFPWPAVAAPVITVSTSP